MGEIFTIQYKNDNSYEGFAKFISEHRYGSIGLIKPTILKVDLTNIAFIFPYDLVSLSCLIEEYYIERVLIIIDPPCKPAIKAYLENIKFFNYWKDGFNRAKYTKTRIDTVLCLWKINFEMTDPYAKYAIDFFQVHFPNLDISALNIAIAELFNNINDHSNSKVSGYVTSQYYPNKKELVLSVCDFGIGISTSLNNYRKKVNMPILSDEEMLLTSLELGISSKSNPKNRGRGLNTIANIVSSLESRLLIFSNNAYLSQESMPSGPVLQKGKLKIAFPGTQIVLFFDTSKFSKQEKEIDQDFYL